MSIITSARIPPLNTSINLRAAVIEGHRLTSMASHSVIDGCPPLRTDIGPISAQIQFSFIRCNRPAQPALYRHLLTPKDVEMKHTNYPLAQTIGRAAREARRTLRLTQEDAAERIAVSVEFYARIERGKSLPSIATFARIVSALGVSADAMLGVGVPRTLTSDEHSVTWMPTPPNDGPELRRLIRRLRRARPSAVRVVGMVLKELEAGASNDQVASEPEPDQMSESKLAGA